MIYVKPYMRGLKSTRLLREQTPFRIRNDYNRIPERSVVLNWGVSKQRCPDSLYEINPQRYSRVISNKLKFAQARFSNAVQFTEDIEEARSWADERGEKVVCRTTLTGHSGEGIVIARNPDQVVEAPLYSLYFPKVREYRIYAGFAYYEQVVTYCASKRNPRDNPVTDRDELLIRSGNRGWVYQVEDTTPEPVAKTAYDFMCELANYTYDGEAWLLAIDMAQNSDGECKVIEANLAAGLNNGSADRVYQAAQLVEGMMRYV